jgi:hypothetical protein
VTLEDRSAVSASRAAPGSVAGRGLRRGVAFCRGRWSRPARQPARLPLPGSSATPGSLMNRDQGRSVIVVPSEVTLGSPTGEPPLRLVVPAALLFGLAVVAGLRDGGFWPSDALAVAAVARIAGRTRQRCPRPRRRRPGGRPPPPRERASGPRPERPGPGRGVVDRPPSVGVRTDSRRGPRPAAYLPRRGRVTRPFRAQRIPPGRRGFGPRRADPPRHCGCSDSAHDPKK